MMRELLVALSGIPGAVFIRDTTINQMSVSHLLKDLPYINPCEIEQLHTLLSLGSNYLEITGQIKEIRSSGVYIAALCAGVEEELELYRGELVDVEKEYLNDPYLSLTHIRHQLHPYFTLLPALHTFLKEIHEKQLHGCSIVSLTYQRLNSTCDEHIQKSMQRLLYRCHYVMYGHLTTWLAHGRLPTAFTLSHHNTTPEFFIQQTEKSCDKDESTVYVHLPLLPPYIPPALADTIVFIGNGMKLLDDHHTAKDRKSAKQEELSLSNEKFLETMAMLRKNERFDVDLLIDVIRGRRDEVAKMLWQLLVVDSGLVKKLWQLKNMFLLGRGDLFDAFIQQASPLLDQAANKSIEIDIGILLEETAQELLLDKEENLLSNFHLTLPIPAAAAASSSGVKPSGWTILSLIYSPPSPLHVFFTPLLLSRYDQVFHLLLSVSHAHMCLSKCWWNRLQYAPKQ